MNIIRHIVFTGKFPDRLLRHLLFWIGQLCFWAFLNASVFSDKTTWQFLQGDLRLHSYFLPDIFFTYFVSYFLARRYLAHNRVRKFVTGLVLATMLTYIFFLVMRFYDYKMFNASSASKIHLVWMYTMKFMNLGPPVVCAMFLSLKFLKQYHQKTVERILLVAENNRSQLGLLKAQIHPHFLFNTLNNIHSFALTDPVVAADLVAKLSDTIKYMIDDCEAPYVDLCKEIKLVNDYMALESVRYTRALNITMNITGDCSDKLVAPLFLIPLIENAYKHGTSRVLTDPWIDLRLHITDNNLTMIIRNGKPPELPQQETSAINPATSLSKPNQGIAGFRSGIGLNNVRKRLELIFPGEHRFLVSEDDLEFSAEIGLPVKQGTTVKKIYYQPGLSEVQ